MTVAAVRIEPATDADVALVADLIVETEAHYGAKVTADVDAVRAALFGPSPAAVVLLAREGDDVLGMASYTFLWPAAGTDRSLYLKELFVRTVARRRGVASALMAELRGIAARAGCSRLEWTADRDNPDAVAFYRSLGADPLPTKMFFRAIV